jgi:hypothetical protein
MTLKNREKGKKFQVLLLDVLIRRLKASPVAWIPLWRPRDQGQAD